MTDIQRIYFLLKNNSQGLKIREIAQSLDLDKIIVSSLLYSSDCSDYWYEDDSLWYANLDAPFTFEEESIQITKEEEEKEEKQEEEVLVGSRRCVNLLKYLDEDSPESLKKMLLEIQEFDVLSDNDLQKLCKGRPLRFADKKVKDYVCKSFLYIVVVIAFRYRNNLLPLEELIQYGSFGLLRAIEKYEPSSGTAFRSYAAYWIMQTIITSVNADNGIVRKPINYMTSYNRAYKLYNKCVQLYEYPNLYFTPNEDEEELINTYWEKIKCNPYPDEGINDVYFFEGNEEESLVDENAFADKGLTIIDNKIEVLKLLLYLKERDRDIIEDAFGIGTSELYSYERIGVKYGLTRERVRQIVARSIDIIRKKLGLKGFNDDGNDSSEENDSEERKITIDKKEIRTLNKQAFEIYNSDFSDFMKDHIKNLHNSVFVLSDNHEDSSSSSQFENIFNLEERKGNYLFGLKSSTFKRNLMTGISSKFFFNGNCCIVSTDRGYFLYVVSQGYFYLRPCLSYYKNGFLIVSQSSDNRALIGHVEMIEDDSYSYFGVITREGHDLIYHDKETGLSFKMRLSSIEGFDTLLFP